MRSSSVNDPKKVFIYLKPSIDNVTTSEISDYIEDAVPSADIILRDDYISHHIGSRPIEELAVELASIKVRDPQSRNSFTPPMQGEIDFEKRCLTDRSRSVHGVLYDGFRLHGIFHSMIPVDEISRENAHIFITDRLFGTYDPDDLRYHARVILCGHPSMISTSGMVVAPARPREYYLKKQISEMGPQSQDEESLKLEFRGQFIDHGDSRMTEVLKGYVLQSIFYQLSGEPFCIDPDCRLFNAHWQSELIHAQLESGVLCSDHQTFLDSLKDV